MKIQRIPRKQREKYAFLAGANIGVGLALMNMPYIVAKIIGFLNIVGSFVNIWDLWVGKIWEEWKDVLVPSLEE